MELQVKVQTQEAGRLRVSVTESEAITDGNQVVSDRTVEVPHNVEAAISLSTEQLFK